MIPRLPWAVLPFNFLKSKCFVMDAGLLPSIKEMPRFTPSFDDATSLPLSFSSLVIWTLLRPPIWAFRGEDPDLNFLVYTVRPGPLLFLSKRLLEGSGPLVFNEFEQLGKLEPTRALFGLLHEFYLLLLAKEASPTSKSSRDVFSLGDDFGCLFFVVTTTWRSFIGWRLC